MIRIMYEISREVYSLFEECYSVVEMLDLVTAREILYVNESAEKFW